MAWGESHRGHEGVRNYYNEWWSAFGNVPTRSRSYVVGGDSLIVETHFVGKHVGRYRGIAPTGHDIDLPVAIFVGFRDGLMSGERFYYDRTTLLTQIGAT
jgi:predicted ester cyclase